MTDIGELVVRIRADAAELEREMQRANGVVKESSSEMGSALKELKTQFAELVPVLSAAAFVEFAHGAIEAADRINDLALRTGIAGTTLSALNIPLKQSGSSVEEFAASVNRMNNLIGEAAKGTNQEAIKAFDALGLSVRKLQQLSPEDQFFTIAEALGKMDNQSEMTNAGMAIFGRGFASLIPLIKETKGHLKEFTDQAKENGDALTQDQLDRIDEWGDRWTSAIEHAKLAIVDYLDYFYKLGEEQRRQIDDADLPENTSHTPGRTVSNEDAARKIRLSLRSKGIDFSDPTPTAKGSNNGLLESHDPELAPYIQSLQEEAEALSKSELALAQYKAEKEGAAKAHEDFKNGLRESPELTDEEKQQIDAATEAYMKQKQALEDLRREEDKHAQVVAQMEAEISSSLAGIALSYKNLGTTVSSVLEQIAKQIIEMQITTPLVEAIGGKKNSPGLLSGLFGSLNIGKMLGFAGGGDPPVGVPSVVGEHGPEIFVPKTAGTVIPNNKIGGSTVVVNQTFSLNPGATEQTVAQLRNLIPAIKADTVAAVFSAMQQGGPASKIIGQRS